MARERILATTAARQFGIICLTQGLAAGLTHKNIEYRLQTGRWERVLPGVYRIAGVPDSWKQRLMAAYLWAGATAAISHRAAARLWGLDGVRDEVIEVASTRKLVSPAEWVIFHQPLSLPSDEITEIDGIQVTTVPRTLLDLGAVVRRDRVEWALDGALRDGLVEFKDLRRTLLRHGAKGRDGTAALRFLLTERDPKYVPPASPLERLFVPILNDDRLPEAVRQHPIVEEGRIQYRLDFAYPEWKIGIEIDSWKHHSGRHSWHRDQTKANVVAVQGWRMLRFTKEDSRKPERVVEVVLSALRHAGYPF